MPKNPGKPHQRPGKSQNHHPKLKISKVQSHKPVSAKDGQEANTRQYTVKEPGELLPFLLEKLSGVGRNSVKAILARGQVSVNGRVVTAYNHPLQPEQIVTINKEKIVEQIPLAGMSILHEDADLIVIQKDSGLLSIATNPEEQQITAYRQLTAHVRNHDPKARIFVVHRLDRDTSGVMMFAKSERVQQHLQNTWQDSVKERTYVALVEGMVKKPEGTISSWLKEHAKSLKMYSTPYPNDGQHAVTHYKTLQANRNYSLLEVNLETGRKNQIRVHMQDIGHPVVGDKKYGSKSKEIGRLGLHARVLAFVHPTTGETLRFETNIPKVFLQPFRDAPSKK
ncbi:RluA family pseudouridine synthase [Paenibacillus sp. GCM10023248]|uniref:RluA family pseudouridine synthase n=1 Tax=Bacillales TaxID=1385 RepID=UPI00237822BD|nr:MULTISPECIES: RluA family pseudouridine synthase [Bacillales]MDD9266470.1 RluA family pseudouridine synthase [Paenibacillus sp. MAHUQ-63]MDR6878595.1 23S rRNA pseudouridine1911/1915/1917 synthase [Bacillus sp. 3255]